MNPIVKYLVSNYVVSEERAEELCKKHSATGNPEIAGEFIAVEEALDAQIWEEEEDIAYERDDT